MKPYIATRKQVATLIREVRSLQRIKLLFPTVKGRREYSHEAVKNVLEQRGFDMPPLVVPFGTPFK